MADGTIRIRGARTHNLQDLDVDLPRQALIVVCGVSGSGKSSLVLDTLGAESRRRFLGTLKRAAHEATEARPDVDAIEGLPPAIAAGFLARRPDARQTLGTLTEITHALRALYARAATPHCPTCDTALEARSREEVVALLLARDDKTRVVLLAPHGRGPEALERAGRDGFVRARLAGGAVARIEEIGPIPEDAEVQVVVDRLVVKEGAADRFRASVEQGLEIGSGVLTALVGDEEITFADRPFCATCNVTWPRLSTAVLSFDSVDGACESCAGRGTIAFLDPERVLPRHLRARRLRTHLKRHLPAAWKWKHPLPTELEPETRERLLAELVPAIEKHGRWERLAGLRTCDACHGVRLSPFARAARLGGRTLPEVESLDVTQLHTWLASLGIEGPTALLAEPSRRDALARAAFLEEVGLGYLQTSRTTSTLSGGELRRARLAAACAARMSGLLFLLDEPTAGLHPSERPALHRRLRALVDEGNTVICVEHDPAMLQHADHALELGPGAGKDGGRILAQGDAATFLADGRAPITKTLGAFDIPLRTTRRRDAPSIHVHGAKYRNLGSLDAEIPLAALTCITGPSGAGKSTLLLDVLAPAVQAVLDRAPFPSDRLDAVEGVESIERVSVARGNASRHPRATPGSVLGVMPRLRKLFSLTLEARTRGWSPARFSRHVKGGRCEVCGGRGERRLELRELAPARTPCDACRGTGFTPDTLRVRVKGLAIADVLALPLGDAAEIFRDIPGVAGPLRAAADVGLGYIPLGEPTSRLSGGEALRLRLASALGRGGEGRTLYCLDEPSAGLHPIDVLHLKTVLLGLAEEGNAVVCVEHHPILVRDADHRIELG